MLLRDPAFRAMMAASALSRLGAAAITVMLGFQVFEITRNPLDLGWLGLVEAVPGIGLVLYGGHVADRARRRSIVLVSLALFVVLALGAALASALEPGRVLPLFAVAFLLGVVRAFEDPAATGMEAQVVPLHALVRGMALLATTGRVAGVLGPVVGGLAWTSLGPAGTYAAIAAVFALALLAALAIPDALQPVVAHDGQGAMVRILEGVRFVFRDQVLLGSMLLDLFAVFFGGATALLPAIATELLHVGPEAFGLLRGAAAGGSLLAAVLAARLLPERKAGQALLWVIAGFGVAIVVFGLSRSFWLSVAALFVSGFCDGLSVVIRRAILRIASPEAMRGRIAAVKSVFVGSSNELGAFESGIAASLLGVSAAVWSGGVVTLLIVAATAVAMPRLRRLDLSTMARA
jgi:MFS family permease